MKGVPALGGNPGPAARRAVRDDPARRLLAFPFPLRNGLTARLELPEGGLDPVDALRLIGFVRSLTILEETDRP